MFDDIIRVIRTNLESLGLQSPKNLVHLLQISKILLAWDRVIGSSAFIFHSFSFACSHSSSRLKTSHLAVGRVKTTSITMTISVTHAMIPGFFIFI